MIINTITNIPDLKIPITMEQPEKVGSSYINKAIVNVFLFIIRLN
jgi:hypothetical protein